MARRHDQVPELIQGFALFAPGVAGIAVISNLSRVMFSIGGSRSRPRRWPEAGCW
jgi:hypothetical protein